MMINKLFSKLLPVNPTMKNGIKISPDATLNVRETTMMSLYRPTDNRSVYYMYFKKILNMVRHKCAIYRSCANDSPAEFSWKMIFS